jgi:hypothetical protein
MKDMWLAMIFCSKLIGEKVTKICKTTNRMDSDQTGVCKNNENSIIGSVRSIINPSNCTNLSWSTQVNYTQPIDIAL